MTFEMHPEFIILLFINFVRGIFYVVVYVWYITWSVLFERICIFGFKLIIDNRVQFLQFHKCIEIHYIIISYDIFLSIYYYYYYYYFISQYLPLINLPNLCWIYKVLIYFFYINSLDISWRLAFMITGRYWLIHYLLNW